ncbi:aminoglycoside phosphotransferase family protein [Catenuloplanes nepalensis]|uniref:aminoglycoside phosphotransferase family protein n=1 Tax=Catenuloplanes nepalensis TaxID=587533 RepID=UPI003F988C40
MPAAPHLRAERAALAHYGGRGAVRLLAHDDADGALLLERAVPGTMLSTLVPHDDAAATAVFVDVVRRLHRPAPNADATPAPIERHADAALAPVERHADAAPAPIERHADATPAPIERHADATLAPVERHADDFEAHLARNPGDELVARALGVHRELCASTTTRVVLHGDLHHGNILAATREPWLAIDPHGRTGDPASEVGAFLYNPDPWVRDGALTRLVPARIEQVADGLALPYPRVVAWGFVLSVLSWVWHVKDGRDYHGRELDVARLLLPKLP